MPRVAVVRRRWQPCCVSASREIDAFKHLIIDGFSVAYAPVNWRPEADRQRAGELNDRIPL